MKSILEYFTGPFRLHPARRPEVWHGLYSGRWLEYYERESGEAVIADERGVFLARLPDAKMLVNYRF